MESPVLRATDLVAGYGMPVLRGVSVEVRAGEVVGLLGPNGAGKTTTMLAISGVLPLSTGTVEIGGSAAHRTLHQRARIGMSFVAEGRGVLMSLTLEENLRLGQGPPAAAYDLFPELYRLRNKKAGQLSGGEQQMLSLARALASNPKLLLIDELSLGLAPQIVERLLRTIRQAADERRMAALVVEQHVDKVLSWVDRAYVLKRGAVQLTGSPEQVRASMGELAEAYLGASGPT
jgi:ABC-type branched-subunit amino acid transport system ATPase component